MQGLKHAYESQAYENESRMGNANIESGHLGASEIWRGDFRGWCIRRWYVFPQKLEQIFVTQRFRFNRDEVYDEEGLFGPVHVEGQPPHLLTFIVEGDGGEEDARTFESVARPWSAVSRLSISPVVCGDEQTSRGMPPRGGPAVQRR